MFAISDIRVMVVSLEEFSDVSSLSLYGIGLRSSGGFYSLINSG